MQLDQGTQSIIAGAVMDFLGHLVARDRALVLASDQPPSALVELKTWAFKQGLDLEQADVMAWDKAPKVLTLDLVASGVDHQHSRIAGALCDFVSYTGSQTVAQGYRQDWETLFQRWATWKKLSVSNPQVHWNFKQWA